jgi:hypothetical protein
MQAPLLENDRSAQSETDMPIVMPLQGRTQWILGTVSGVVIQATCWANYEILSQYWGVVASSQQQLWVLCGVLSFCSALTAMVAIEAVRFCIRGSRCAQLDDDDDEDNCINDENKSSDNSSDNNSSLLALLERECRFVEGVFIGICLAGVAADVASGMLEHVLYSGSALVFAIAWCQFVQWFFARNIVRYTTP